MTGDRGRFETLGGGGACPDPPCTTCGHTGLQHCPAEIDLTVDSPPLDVACRVCDCQRYTDPEQG